jgi:uncharacterized protein (DUF302 family)
MKIINIVISVLLITIGYTAISQNTNYYFSKQVDENYQAVIQNIKIEAKKHGFGVLNEGKMHKTLSEKLEGVEMDPYVVLDLCNPNYAWKAIQTEANVGLFLPCKVIVKSLTEERTEVIFVKPNVTMSVTKNSELMKIANDVTEIMKRIFDSI